MGEKGKKMFSVFLIFTFPPPSNTNFINPPPLLAGSNLQNIHPWNCLGLPFLINVQGWLQRTKRLRIAIPHIYRLHYKISPKSFLSLAVFCLLFFMMYLSSLPAFFNLSYFSTITSSLEEQNILITNRNQLTKYLSQMKVVR